MALPRISFDYKLCPGACVSKLSDWIAVNGLNGLERLGVVMMPDGSPAASYRAHGLVLGVSNQEQLRSTVKKVNSDPEACLLTCKRNYDIFFAEPNGSISKTVEIIMRLLSEQPRNGSVA